MGDLVVTAAAFNSGGELRLMCLTKPPFDQSLVTNCCEGREEVVPMDWRSLWQYDLHIADCVRNKREQSCCLPLSLMEGVFAAAAEDATEDFFGCRPVSFLGAFFVGIISLVSFLDGTNSVGDNQCGKNYCEIL